jgi:adenosylcobinamide-GDP ribazoletransferase
MDIDEPPYADEFATWRDDVRLAVSFLTRLRLRPAGPPPPGALAQAGWVFPLVGGIVGILGFVAYWIAAALGLPPSAAALLAVAATALATGALHEDGLADTADGFGGGRDPAQKLAIMRDSRSGAFGVLALVFSVGLRAAAIAAIADAGLVLPALVAAHAVARGALPMVMRRLPPARADGLGAAAGRPAPEVAGAAAAIAVLVAFVCLGFWLGLAALAAACIGMALLAALARRQVGGYTGDVLGAIEQGGEIIMLLAASTWSP